MANLKTKNCNVDFPDLFLGYGDFLRDSFLRYVRIDTTSDPKLALEKTPSTAEQWNLLKLLQAELKQIGVNDTSLDENGFLIARVPGNTQTTDTIGFIAHVDTSSELPGKNVNPIVHESYNGKKIKLKNGVVLNPATMEKLSDYVGETIITSDGTTLLGADDKAGIAVIITTVRWLMDNPDYPRPNLEFIFTPDEETGGAGIKRFPLEKLKSQFCFTLDGSAEGELESECFHAMSAQITFHGVQVHQSNARGELVNALSMAAQFINMIPRNESPEATDGRYGNYWPHELEGKVAMAHLNVMYRSFESQDIQRKTEALKNFARAVEFAFPGGRVEIESRNLYSNMRKEINKHPKVLQIAREAIQACNIQAIENPIRGGTDGASLTAMGIPTPNLFAGGMNFHSLTEWVALPAMMRATHVVIKTINLWVNY